MTYVIAQPCVGVKDGSCVQVCPVDCIHPAPGEPGFDESPQLYIDPLECIDCHSCAQACPVDAALPEEDLPPEWMSSLEVNAAFFTEKGPL
ncbi:indolepyruvate ferredoxin oxidoreductase subunit alpha [Actinomadura rudentiformis]|uniref:Ferredoxin n=1 Tax=Actinomadura rudentiformis TaxID=359158 RepID=A0A6H9YFB4_9ACTN|nr:4Fe-4S binding protein [Actinomadura rudentiformis]KAB2342454.1 4Fe-4S dicluster domain-containing protein [Actinomadura rudentiformis]